MNDIDKTLSDLGLTLEVVKGPEPRMKDKWQCIGYDVIIKINGRKMLRTEYNLGLGHVKLRTSVSMTMEERRFMETWQNKPHAVFLNKDFQTQVAAKAARDQKVKPKLKDVMYSLTMDGDVLNYGDFEEWAESFGYDPDSIKANEIYRACLGNALKLRAAIGEKGLSSLEEAYQDY